MISSQLFAALHGLPSERLMAIAREFSPRVERHPGETVVLDIAGLQRLLGDAASIGAELGRAGAPRVAIAATQTAALVIVRACPGVTIAMGDPEAAVRDVPLATLEALLVDREQAAAGAPPRSESGPRRRPPAGSVQRVFETLSRWGLGTLGELAALPPGGLAARLGGRGPELQRLARGLDIHPLVPDPGVRRFIESYALEWPIDTIEPLSFVLARLLDPLASALEQADRGAVALHLRFRLTDKSTYVRRLSLPAPLRDPRVLRTLVLLDLESHPPAAAVDEISLELDPAPARIVQYSLLERAQPSPETLATLMARLGALVGESRCGTPVLLDTHRPDAFEMDQINIQRPTAEVPVDVGTWQLGVVLRRFRPPVAIRVAVEGHRPVRVAIDRRGMPGGVVTQSAGPWRTSGDWWQPTRWNRDEWDVGLSDGAVCRLFRDRDAGQWFLDGVYD